MSLNETPMMQQYAVLRDANPGFLLFYRMGDFYELFGEQAVAASEILGVTLTRRRTAKEGDAGIPMCGVPFHAAEGYIAKLLKHGLKVALCEQMEDPETARQARGAKALVRRDVVRLYTGGTLTEDSMLRPEQNNYLMILSEADDALGMAWADVSTGEFYASCVGVDVLPHEVARLQPKEIVLSETLNERYGVSLGFAKDVLTVLPNNPERVDGAERRLKTVYKLGTLEALGLHHKALVAACGGLLAYVEQTQTGRLPLLHRPVVLQERHFMHLDASTRQNLELTQTLKGERAGSLLAAIDETVTPAGSRLLAQWVTSPLCDVAAIGERQEAIARLAAEAAARQTVREILRQTHDMGRSMGRLTLDRGSPRDLGALRQTLRQFPALLSVLGGLDDLGDSGTFGRLVAALSGFEGLSDLLERALSDENLPMLARDGGFVREGFCAQLDGYKVLSSGGMDLLRQLERDEAERTGISSLRIRYNKVWGYFIEVTNGQVSKVPEDYIHRQTTTSSQRFSTARLMTLEREYSAAEANSLAREEEIFGELCGAVKAEAERLLSAAEALARLDVLAAGAELAQRRRYVRPVVSADRAFYVKEGRHPVVERTVDTFVPNGADLSDGKLWLMTGPNMAGKSTFLRQNALIAVLAHMGYFVPATEAKIGLIDRVFTRVGAADDLAKGQSTFMVEMVETANILNHATDRSLVVLDEIGRGTATYDGLSIAWACVEHLLTVNKCRGLFATHYHELTGLAEQFPLLENYHASVREWQGDVVFLHEMKAGAAPGSYGVHVGRLAGLPESVTARAAELLGRLERQSVDVLGGVRADETPSGGADGVAVAGRVVMEAVPAPVAPTPVPAALADLPLFGVSVPSVVERRLRELRLDDMTPRQAQDVLYELARMVL